MNASDFMTTKKTSTPRTDDDRIAANAALLRLFKNQYRESSDRHSDALFARDYVGTLERELTQAQETIRELREQIAYLDARREAGLVATEGLYAELASLREDKARLVDVFPDILEIAEDAATPDAQPLIERARVALAAFERLTKRTQQTEGAN